MKSSWQRFSCCSYSIFLFGVGIPVLARSRIDFQRDIEPIFRERCQMCHGPSRQMGGLRLDNRRSVLKGGDSGPALRPGNSTGNKLVQLVSCEEKDLVMPLGS